MPQRKEIIEQAGIYTLSSQITQLITLVAAILSRRFLGPTQVGIWAALQVLVEYSKYSSLGSLYSVAREVPYLVGKGQSEAAHEIKNVVFTVVLYGSLLLGCVIFLFALLTRSRLAPEMTYGLFFVSAIIVFQRINDLLISLLRCYKKFTLASKQMIWSSLVNAVLVSSFAYYFKIYGFIWAIGLSLLFNIGYILTRHNFHFKIQFQTKRFQHIVSFGFPLMMIGILTTVLRSIDKILVAKLLGFEALGFYSIAFMVTTYTSSFSNAIAIVLVPHLQEKYGVHDNPRELAGFLSKAGDVFSITTPVLIGAAWILAPYLVQLFLPNFVSGIEAMQFLSCSIFFTALAQPYGDFLITIKKHFLLFPLLGGTALLSLAMSLGAVRFGYGISGVALASTLSAFFNAAATYWFAARHLTHSREALQKGWVFMSRFFYLLFIIGILRFGIPADIPSIQVTCVRFFAFLLLYSPLLFQLNRQFRLLPFVREKWYTPKYVPSEGNLNL